LGEGRAAIVATVRSAGGWLPGGRVGVRALATLCAAASASAVLILPAAPAEAKESLKQAKAKLDKLNSQFDHADDAYNKAKDQREAAQKKLASLNKSVADDKKTYEQLRERVAQLAVSAYKNGGEAGEIPNLVSAKDPQDVLDQISVFAQVTKNRSTEVTQFLNAAQLLQRQQAQAQQAAQDLAQKAKDEKSRRESLKKKAAQQQALVNKLGGGSSRSGGVGGTYTGPASGNARTVLNWAYSKLGTPYEYGGTGPRYDCSGFVMVAWRQAGVSLPRVVPDQYSATRRVAKADLQPGDLVFFDNLGHVGIYVGGGKFVHSPHTGDVVKISSMSESWYASNYVGAGRP
jgi:cell wall-associated NlpC family hydrolase